jgi:DnaJ-class molecular chaperone
VPPVQVLDTTGAGDLYAVLSVEVPSPLTEPEKRLFEELRRASKFNPRGRFG